MATAQRKTVKITSRTIKGAALCITALAASQAYAAPRSIDACTTITKPGSYVLSDDIVYGGERNDACIKVMVSRVNIDLDGHTMSWPGPHTTGSGPIAILSANDTEHVTVRDGSISGFGAGVRLLGTGSTVKDIHVGGPCPCEGYGIEANGVIKDNVVSVFSVPDNGAGIVGSGVIKGNYVYDTRTYGMFIGKDSSVIGNTVTGTNGGPGIGISVECPSTIAHNTVTGSSGENIATYGEGCIVKDNTAP